MNTAKNATPNDFTWNEVNVPQGVYGHAFSKSRPEIYFDVKGNNAKEVTADIVRAVNSHDALLEALQFLKSIRHKCFIPNDVFSPSGWSFDTLLDKAIQLAEKQ